jgi:hypothetical protein
VVSRKRSRLPCVGYIDKHGQDDVLRAPVGRTCVSSRHSARRGSPIDLSQKSIALAYRRLA